jgi:hypothetical protein
MHRPARANLRRFGLPILVGLAILGFLVGVELFRAHLAANPLGDVRAYYDAGARLNAGVPLYDQPATTDEAAFYRYPPLLAILFRPLALLPFESAALIWEALVVVTFGLTLLHLGVRRMRTWLLVGFLGLAIGWSLAIGQAQVPVTYLVALGTPLSIALAGQLKLLPALVAVWWIGRRDWRSLRRFVAWTAGLVAVQLVLEPAGTLAYPATLGLQQVGEVRNWSPYAISPWLWAGLLVVGFVLAIRLAPGRYGWAAAVSLSILAAPRLLFYQLMTLLAAAREPATADATSSATASATPLAIRSMPGASGAAGGTTR